MKLNTILVACALMTSGLTSCEKVTGDGPVIDETRTITGFNSLTASIGGTVYYTPGTSYSVKIRAQRNILDIIQTQSGNGELRIKFKNVRIGHHDDIQVFITAPDLNRFEVSGSGSIRVTQPYQPLNLDLRISGSGSIDIFQLNTQNLHTRTSGSGDITVQNGTADKTVIEISGSGSTNLLGMNSKEGDVFISGSGNVKLAVSEKLDGNISGSGDIYYKGSPKVNSHISGSGKIRSW